MGSASYVLVDVTLAAIDIPFRRVDARILDHGCIELIQVYAKLLRLVVVEHCEMTDDHVAAGASKRKPQ